MDTEILLAITGPVSAIVGGALTALVMLKTEKRRQKAELERLKLAWRREDRVKSLEPVRNYLNKLADLVGQIEAAETIDHMLLLTDKAGAVKDLNLIKDLVENIIELQTTAHSVMLRIADPALNDLLNKLSIRYPEDILENIPEIKFSPDYKKRIQAAYKRLEELGSEL